MNFILNLNLMEEKIHGSSENRSTKKALSIDGEIINMNDNEL